MIKRMRVRLSVTFGFLVLVLYSVGALLSLGVFQQGLNRSTDALLVDLLSEVRPAVSTSSVEQPSLKDWDRAARMENLPVLATIQIFDPKGTLLESYGPTGVGVLTMGRVHVSDAAGDSRSVYQQIMRQDKKCGFLQVQVSTAHDDRSLNELKTAIVLAFPGLVGLVAFGGYLFVGMALRPVELTMDLLRRFVADAGHELKTPLSVIEAAIETIEHVHKEHNLSELETDMIRSASKRMRGLTEDLMFLARVEDPMRAFAKQVLSLNTLVEEEVQEYAPLAESSRLKLEMTSNEPLEIVAEPESFRQLVSNLLSNAIKYNEPGGSVFVSLKKEGLQARLTVADTGIGINESDMVHLYERFYRADKSRFRGAGGAGLGLAIVKAVADAHQASIEVVSTAGEGTTFIILVPLAATAASREKKPERSGT